MTNKLISLALLVFFLMTSYSHSENQFLFPKKKPSVFKKIDQSANVESLKNLPQKRFPGLLLALKNVCFFIFTYTFHGHFCFVKILRGDALTIG